MRVLLLFVLCCGVKSFFVNVEGEYELVLEDHDTYCEEYGLLINPSTLEPTRLDHVSCENFADLIHSGDILRMLVESNQHETIESIEEFRIAELFTVVSKKDLGRNRQGPQRVVIVLMNYRDAPAVFGDCDQQCIRDFTWSQQFNLDTLYRQSSYGAVSFPEAESTIVAVDLPYSREDHKRQGKHDLGRIRADATTALRQQHNIDVDHFDFVAVYTRALDGPGVAFVGGKFSFINSNHPDTLAHEIGHNFGNLHAGLDMANNLQPTEEYGDRSSIMGLSHESLRGFSMPQQIHAGWVPPNRVVAITDVCDNQFVTLHATHTIPSDPRTRLAVTIPRDSTRTYVLSLRTPVGHDELLRPQYMNKVSLHYMNKAGVSNLVALIAPNSEYQDPVNKYVIKVGRLHEDSVTVTLCPVTPRPVPESASGVALAYGKPASYESASSSSTRNADDDDSTKNILAIAAIAAAGIVGAAVVAVLIVMVGRRNARSELKASLVSLTPSDASEAGVYHMAPENQ